MTGDLLQQIQRLQFSNKGAAEALLLTFLKEIFTPDVERVELRPLAVSLNSFNGFVTLANRKRLFFKTHTEPDGVIGEYYHAAQLAEAGYPVIQPIFSSTTAGKQLLVYEVVEDASVFDVAWQIENGQDDLLPVLTAAQNRADDQLFQLYTTSLTEQSADEAARAPIHQLFYHRLTGGRLERFYGMGSGEDKVVLLPNRKETMGRIRDISWIINGCRYEQTIAMLINEAAQLLQPAQNGPSVVGHGDAHNGNVFFHADETLPSLTYFDPAFAGRHQPLLDLTKPLFHNVFAMWMYYPQVKRDRTTISLTQDGNIWRVEHDYALHPIRDMFLRSKVDRVLLPILKLLKAQGSLREDWRRYLKAALFCCPFLTMNLADAEKFPPEISLLGLAMSVEMGGESYGRRSLIDQTLDEVEARL